MHPFSFHATTTPTRSKTRRVTARLALFLVLPSCSLGSVSPHEASVEAEERPEILPEILNDDDEAAPVPEQELGTQTEAAPSPEPARDFEVAATEQRAPAEKQAPADAKPSGRAKKDASGGEDLGGIASFAKPTPAKRPATAPTSTVQTKPAPGWTPPRDVSGEGYDHVEENAFVAVDDDPLSTFSIDVDTAAYANVRRFLEGGQLPPPDAVRIEEMINYFSYAYPTPKGQPFSLSAEVGPCPWNGDHLLAQVGLQGMVIDQSQTPARNLVFLLDVSGSMETPDKLPLLKQALSLLVNQLRPEDKVSIVVYAGASGVVLEPTSGTDRPRILASLEQLSAGGSTNGGAGIEAAYRLAEQSFVKDGINRVILATDGDFNVGPSTQGQLIELIEAKRNGGVFLSVLGFGTGNVQDSTMEQIADHGNGNYAYIDTLQEAKKVLVEEAGATLVTIAKDVKIQVEWNPSEVLSYRLVGYENRKLAHADFNDDTKDAGEIGAGHSVTAIYEIVPKSGRGGGEGKIDPLKYQTDRALAPAAHSGELMNVKIRYKEPRGDASKLLTFPVVSGDQGLSQTSSDFRFAAAVAEFGLLLKHSKHRGEASYGDVLGLAEGAIGKDPHGHRKGFLDLVALAQRLDRR